MSCSFWLSEDPYKPWSFAVQLRAHHMAASTLSPTETGQQWSLGRGGEVGGECGTMPGKKLQASNMFSIILLDFIYKMQIQR